MVTVHTNSQRKLPGGRQLKALVARQQRQQPARPIDTWEAYDARRLALVQQGKEGRKPGA